MPQSRMSLQTAHGVVQKSKPLPTNQKIVLKMPMKLGFFSQI